MLHLATHLLDLVLHLTDLSLPGLDLLLEFLDLVVQHKLELLQLLCEQRLTGLPERCRWI